ncbi:hypothetical protein BU024_10485 [Staphylococcus simulans]|nr:hypothetical protein BU024_10485 [Staphylococcus simulans]
MIEREYNFWQVVKHIFTHKSLKAYGYKLMIIRLLYAIVFPFVLIFKMVKYLFTYDKNRK